MANSRRNTAEAASVTAHGTTRKAANDARPAELSPGEFAYDGLDRLLHEKARLGIITSLYTHPEGLLFGDLKDLCGLTDGNLSRHLQILADGKLIEIWKGFRKRRPQTLCRLTSHGRARFVEYVGELERVLSTVAKFSSASNPQAASTDARGLRAEGWTPA